MSESSGQSSAGQAPKIFAPYVPPSKSFQPFTPSIPTHVSPTFAKNNEQKIEDFKYSKYSNQMGSQVSGVSPKNSKLDNPPIKPISTFFEGRSYPMKGSMMTSQSQINLRVLKSESSPEQLYLSQSQSSNPLHRKTYRISENPDMKISSIEFGTELVKAPSFLNDKLIKEKKLPQYNVYERPDSFKDMTGLINSTSESLTNSYGNVKKLREFQIKKDPISEWKSSSFNKRKQKNIGLNNFLKLKELGQGKYGKVYLVYEKQTHFVCALKVLEKSLIRQEEIAGQLIRQLKIQSFLNHTNLIKMYGFFDDETSIYLIMEVATGGQLFKQIKKHNCMPEPKVAAIMKQVCSAVNELHSHRIIHRDIKPQNIVLHENVIKLCDFGWSVYCDSNLRTTFCGTPLYVGPQILKGKQYDEKIDIWSLGVMLYQMLVGENPFKINQEEDLIKIIRDEIKIPSFVEISKEAQNFLFSCLQKNPEKRISIRELINHQFFKKYPDKNDKNLF